jgi:hypothetical protein
MTFRRVQLTPRRGGVCEPAHIQANGTDFKSHESALMHRRSVGYPRNTQLVQQSSAKVGLQRTPFLVGRKMKTWLDFQ